MSTRSRRLAAVLVGLSLGLQVRASVLERRLDAILDDARLASASVGALVVETQEGKVLYERDAERALMPASNMKLVTSLAALRFLGVDFHYSTALCAEGAPNGEGCLAGSLYLRGSGDPTLTHEDLGALASRLAETGLKRITGDIVADASCFPGPPLGLGWPWNDETYAYSAQISGLCVDSDTVRAEVAGGSQPGDPCRLVLTPSSDHLALDPECVTGPADARKPGVFRRRASNLIATTGPVPAGQRVSATVTMEEPDLYAARLLLQCLTGHGIAVGGACRRGITPQAATSLVTHESRPLGDILALMNVSSDNGIAEGLLRTIPLARGRPGTASEATKMIQDWLPEIDVSVRPLRLCDGSGLSRLDLLTPRAIVGLLRHAATHAKVREPFVASLPVAGQSGTLARRMKDTPAAGRVRAKTGSLWGVSTLSGYVAGEDECALTFSLMMNNYTCGTSAVRELQDRVCVALARYANARRPAEQ
jgi:D-alanyl-D-alanine carboxypeptidase/D-alanyl-D-alanine-endopeptidase (penicillin-binding protein 4)